MANVAKEAQVIMEEERRINFGVARAQMTTPFLGFWLLKAVLFKRLKAPLVNIKKIIKPD